jgi:hypothetical protein
VSLARWAAVTIASAVLCLSCKREPSSRQGRHTPVGAATTASELGKVLRDGDLIFHESRSSQSEMVRALTGSRWTHMGVIFSEPQGLFVFEAVSPVKTTPLKQWIGRGKDQRYVVKRLRDAETRLSPQALEKMRKLGASWLGRPYDPRFRWDDQTLYCSELAYKLFERGAAVQLGKLQKASEMNLDDERVQQALKKRFGDAQLDPSETVVTPDSIFNDDRLVEVKLP